MNASALRVDDLPEEAEQRVQAVLFPGSTRPAPYVSVVIPTYLRPGLLLRCLRALLNQDFERSDYEIIVVDDGCDEATQRVVAAFARRSGDAPAVRYLVADCRQGPAAARNFGWHHARGSLIAFTDDDTVPARDWLRQGAAAMTPQVGAVGGRVVVPLPPEPTAYELDASRPERAEFVSANCFVRRRVLAGIGGFDERFTAAWREDADLQFRLIEFLGSEHRIARCDAAVVVHPVRPAPWGVSLLQQRKLQFDALLYRKHPLQYRARIRAEPRWDYYLAVAMMLTGLAAALAGAAPLALLTLGIWSLLTLRFCRRRLHGTARSVSHVLEMLITSMLLPPLAVFWRCIGALRYRVLLA